MLSWVEHEECFITLGPDAIQMIFIKAKKVCVFTFVRPSLFFAADPKFVFIVLYGDFPFQPYFSHSYDPI